MNGFLRGPVTGGDARAGDEARHDEERLKRRRGRGGRERVGEDQGLSAMQDVGADVLELAKLCFVAVEGERGPLLAKWELQKRGNKGGKEGRRHTKPLRR